MRRPLWIMAIFVAFTILIAGVGVTACGSGAKTYDAPAPAQEHKQLGSFDLGQVSGHEIWYFNPETGTECYMATNDFDSSVGLSCNWPPVTTPVTPYDPTAVP